MNKTILIVDDNEVSLKYLMICLRDESTEILTASNGQEAVDICIKNKQIDLILIDIQMPVLDGYVASELIKKLIPNVFIIVQTGFPINTGKEFSNKIFDGIVAKPIDIDELKLKIDLLLDFR